MAVALTVVISSLLAVIVFLIVEAVLAKPGPEPERHHPDCQGWCCRVARASWWG